MSKTVKERHSYKVTFYW